LLLGGMKEEVAVTDVHEKAMDGMKKSEVKVY
jgi:hypothetical protein